MGKGKLFKFAENETFACLIQPSLDQVLDKSSAVSDPAVGSGSVPASDSFCPAPTGSLSPSAGTSCPTLIGHPLRGNWGRDFFHNDHPIVLELGCGKGDYTIALALRHPEINYIGVDIKGARMWKGAKMATQMGLKNVGFLRTRIEFIGSLFGPDEVSEIWLTFSDPQIGREKKRLTSPRFLARYADFLRADGTIHLKTDSRYLYEYTHALCQANALPISFATSDLYALAPDASATPSGSPTAQASAPADSHVIPGSTGYPSTADASASAPVSVDASAPAPADAFASVRPQAESADAPASASAAALDPALFEVQTFYEKHFLAQGYRICYLAFTLAGRRDFLSPDWDEPRWADEDHHAFLIQIHE